MVHRLKREIKFRTDLVSQKKDFITLDLIHSLNISEAVGKYQKKKLHKN